MAATDIITFAVFLAFVFAAHGVLWLPPQVKSINSGPNDVVFNAIIDGEKIVGMGRFAYLHSSASDSISVFANVTWAKNPNLKLSGSWQDLSSPPKTLPDGDILLQSNIYYKSVLGNVCQHVETARNETITCSDWDGPGPNAMSSNCEVKAAGGQLLGYIAHSVILNDDNTFAMYEVTLKPPPSRPGKSNSLSIWPAPNSGGIPDRSLFKPLCPNGEVGDRGIFGFTVLNN